MPSHGLTGYYLSLPEEENLSLCPIGISPSETRSYLKKKIYEGYPKGSPIEETTEKMPINIEWHSDDKKSYKSPFTIEWDGLLKIQHRCNYTFILGSDDGSALFLNGKLIIDNGGTHGLKEKTQTLLLEPGFYRFHLTYFDQGGGAVLYLKWKYSDVDGILIPPSQFYQETTIQDLHTIDTTTPYTLKIEPNDTIDKSYVVFRKNDPTLAFTNYGILRTYYVNYWDNYRFEPPAEPPAYNILWRGSIWIPKDGTYTFKVNANGDAFLYIDARLVVKYRAGSDPTGQIHLEKGRKTIQINYYNTTKYATIQLLWQKPGIRKPTNIPSRYLLPSEDAGCFGGARIWYAAGFIAAALLVVLGVFLCIRQTVKCRIQAYFAYVKQNWSTVALVLVVILGAVLRLNNYSVIPPHGETMDVYQEAWKGFNILHGEGPKSWGAAFLLPAYKDEDQKFFRWFGDGFTIVRRHIDHAPLFSIFAGIPPTICGAKNYLDCRLTTIALTPVFFSTLTIILVYLVSYKIYRSDVLSIIASLLYATVPLFVAAGRIAKGDCLLALVLISTVLCILKYAECKKKQYVIFAGLLAGVSFWCKETGICVLVIMPVLFGRRGLIKEAVISAGIGVFVALGYLLYNYLINPHAFFKILSLYSAHQSRPSFNMVVTYIREPKIVLSYAGFGMGYLLWFWFVLVYSMGKRDATVPITAFIFLMTVCVLVQDTLPFGWYIMPLYPFMAIAGSLFLRDFISRSNTAKALLLLLVLMAVPLKEILPGELYRSPWLFRGYLAIGILPFLAFDFFKHRITATVAKVACYTYIAFVIVMNVYSVYHLPDLYDPMKR